MRSEKKIRLEIADGSTQFYQWDIKTHCGFTVIVTSALKHRPSMINLPMTSISGVTTSIFRLVMHLCG